MKYLSPLLLVLLPMVTACGSTKFIRTGPRATARERLCEFQLFATPPVSGFVELGVIDVKPGSYGANEFRDPESFKRDIRMAVCEAGGDAVVAVPNAKGLYDKASVLKEVVQTAAPVQATPGATAAPAGCSFDAQCKGDRLCMNGVCVAPTAAAPSK